jgi:hypothetical protein
MVETYTRVQGASLWLNITCDNIADIDMVWTNWSGKWSIVSAIGSPALLSGTMTKGTIGLFYLRIGPAVTGWNTLPPGKYFLLTQIENTTVDYNNEDQDKLTIKPQGLA